MIKKAIAAALSVVCMIFGSCITFADNYNSRGCREDIEYVLSMKDDGLGYEDMRRAEPKALSEEEFAAVCYIALYLYDDYENNLRSQDSAIRMNVNKQLEDDGLKKLAQKDADRLVDAVYSVRWPEEFEGSANLKEPSVTEEVVSAPDNDGNDSEKQSGFFKKLLMNILKIFIILGVLAILYMAYPYIMRAIKGVKKKSRASSGTNKRASHPEGLGTRSEDRASARKASGDDSHRYVDRKAWAKLMKGIDKLIDYFERKNGELETRIEDCEAKLRRVANAEGGSGGSSADNEVLCNEVDRLRKLYERNSSELKEVRRRAEDLTSELENLRREIKALEYRREESPSYRGGVPPAPENTSSKGVNPSYPAQAHSSAEPASHPEPDTRGGKKSEKISLSLDNRLRIYREQVMEDNLPLYFEEKPLIISNKTVRFVKDGLPYFYTVRIDENNFEVYPKKIVMRMSARSNMIGLFDFTGDMRDSFYLEKPCRLYHSNAGYEIIEKGKVRLE